MVTGEGGHATAVDRALAILEAVAHRTNGLTNSEISRRLSIPKSSASYILRTLEKRGYLRRERGTGKYRLGLRVLALSRGVLVGLDIRELALPILRQLVEKVNLTAHVAILDHGEAVYVERVEAMGFIKMDTWVGRRMDIHSTSVGKVLAAQMPESDIDAVIRERGLKKRTPKTIATGPKLVAELQKVRAQGYAIDDEENNLGVRCVAAPVYDGFGMVQAAVGVSGTTSQIDRESITKIVETVKETARRISIQLGYRTASRTSPLMQRPRATDA